MLTVLRQRNVFLLWISGLVSIAGDWMLMVALPISVYQLSGSPTAISGVVVAGTIPSVAFGSIAGVFVDRWSRKWTMVVVNLARGPVLLLLLFVESSNDIWIIYVVTFTNSLFSQFFKPAENALLPQVVGRDQLVAANTLNALNNNLAGLVGPALGGVVAASFGLRGVAMIDAASFLLAGGLVAAITLPRVKQSRERDTSGTLTVAKDEVAGGWRELWHEWLAGIEIIPRSRILIALFAVSVIIAIGNVGFTTLLAPFVAEALDGGAQEVGWLLTGQAVGGVVGVVALGHWGSARSPAWLLGWGLISGGILSVAFFLYPIIVGGIGIGILLMVISGIPVTAVNTSATTLLQLETDDAYRGRVFGSIGTTMALTTIIAAPSAGFAATRLGIIEVLTFLSVTYIVAGAVTLRSLQQGRVDVSRLALASPKSAADEPPNRLA
jgi:MFS family permease